MTGRPADPLTTIREALAIAWPEGDHAEPNIYTEALASLAAVERLVEAAHSLDDHEAIERDWEVVSAEAMSAVREALSELREERKS